LRQFTRESRANKDGAVRLARACAMEQFYAELAACRQAGTADYETGLRELNKRPDSLSKDQVHSRVLLLPRELLAKNPLDAEFHELFLMGLYEHACARSGGAVVPAPSVETMYFHQHELYDQSDYRHSCHGDEGGCEFWSMSPGQVYFSLWLRRPMTASGAVFVCRRTGRKHLCNDECAGSRNNAEGYVCSISGRCKTAVFKFAPEIVSRNGQIQYIIGANTDDYTHYHEVDDDDYLPEESEYHDVVQACKDDDERTAEETQWDRILALPLEDPKKTPKPPKPRTRGVHKRKLSAAKFQASDKLRKQLRLSIHDEVERRFNKPRVTRTPEEAVTAARKVVLKYVKYCVETKRAPSQFFGMQLYQDTIRQVLEPKAGPVYQQKFVLFYTEVILYYWRHLQPVLYGDREEAPWQWIKRCEHFGVALLHLLKDGFKVGKRQLFPGDAFIEKNLSLTIKTDDGKQRIFQETAQITAAIQKQAKTAKQLEALAFANALPLIQAAAREPLLIK
jgi:hypothetical protein